MRILIVTQYFYPEDFKGNQIAFELSKKGYDVTVIAGIPNYPKGEFFSGYGFFNKRRETINGVKVIRVPLVPRGKGGRVNLLLNYFSFPFFATFYCVYYALIQRFDVIFVQQLSPVLMSLPAIITKKIIKKPLYTWVLDLWPESLTAAGGIKNKYILSFFEYFVKKQYKNSDKILISSKGFKESILKRGDFEHKLEYFPNWAEDVISNGSMTYPIPDLPNGFIIMFAGNIGEAQDLDTIMEAAILLKEQTNIKFVILGDGRKMSFVQECVQQNKLNETVFTLGRYPVESMASFFDKANLLLVSLKDDFIFNLTVPAKVQAYMSSGKPIIAMLNGDGAELINEAKCGFSVPASNAFQLKETIVKASQMHSDDLMKMGENGKKYFDANFRMEKCINHLEKILLSK